MFARKVSMHLKADYAGDFIKKMENEIIPLLRQHTVSSTNSHSFRKAVRKFTPIVSGKTALTPKGTKRASLPK